MSFLVKLTHDSLSTTIAWVSSCLLAGGISTLFNEDIRFLWMIWGCFGLTAAVGLDVVARFRERLRIEDLARNAVIRLEHDIKIETKAQEENAAIREVIGSMLSKMHPIQDSDGPRRMQARHSCNLDAVILPQGNAEGVEAQHDKSARNAKITNLSFLGFELTLTDTLKPQQITIIMPEIESRQVKMLGEVLWCRPQSDGTSLAGGRFLNVVQEA